jgi:glycosyltransferase involved in cell wall biosynthesis
VKRADASASPVALGTRPDGATPPTQTSAAPVRLLKVLTLFAAGGTEGQVLNLVRRLDRTRYDLQFVCLRKWGHYLEEVEQRKIPITEYATRSFYSVHAILQQLRFARQLRAQRIQIMHSYNFYSNVFAIPAAKLAGVPLIIASIRDQGVYMSSLQKFAQKLACRMADVVLCNAGSIRDWLIEEGYQPEKIRIIRNGIDLSRYRAVATDAPTRASTLRQELGLPPTAPLVVMLSRLNAQKGVDDFIKAAALISLRMPEVRFLLVGEKLLHKQGTFEKDASYHMHLQQLCRDLGVEDKIVFTGHRSDVPELLAEGTVSVLPSHSEGLSNTLLESMAAGLPIVATCVGGNGELVDHGLNGFLVPPQNPATLADAIMRILADSDLARRFSQASRAKAEQYFSMERMVQDTEALYDAQLAARTT